MRKNIGYYAGKPLRIIWSLRSRKISGSASEKRKYQKKVQLPSCLKLVRMLSFIAALSASAISGICAIHSDGIAILKNVRTIFVAKH